MRYSNLKANHAPFWRRYFFISFFVFLTLHGIGATEELNPPGRPNGATPGNEDRLLEASRIFTAQASEEIPPAGSFRQPTAAMLKGKLAPDFTLESITGEKYSFSAAKGKVVLIDFWHTY